MILKEYISFVLPEEFLPIEKAATFIVDQFDAIVEIITTEKPKPILDSTIIKKYMDGELDTQTKETILSNILDNIVSTVRELPMCTTRREELLASVDLLKDEIQEKFPKKLLIHALLAYLETEKELKSL